MKSQSKVEFLLGTSEFIREMGAFLLAAFYCTPNKFGATNQPNKFGCYRLPKQFSTSKVTAISTADIAMERRNMAPPGILNLLTP